MTTDPPRATAAPAVIAELARFIATRGHAGRLAADHADDGRGCCRTCSGGAQTGRYRYPCTILLAAAEVR